MSTATAVDDVGTSVSPTARSTARSLRLPVIAGTLVVALAVVVALAADDGVGTLDIDSASRPGSQAVAELLRDQGVDVRQVRLLDEAAATGGGTLVVVGGDLLDERAVGRLTASGASTVVVAGATTTEAVEAFAPGVEVDREVEAGVSDPACALPAASLAGRADSGVVTFTAKDGVAGPPGSTSVGCYPTGGAPSLLELRSGDRRTVLLGNAQVLQNERLGKEGNAALALNLLGADGDVTWYLPSLSDLYGIDDDPDAGASVLDLVPDRVLGALAWLGVVVLLLAAWRARRFGALVDEPLPVVVRASETDEGRARLYRRGGNRDRAAALLRAATCDRLAPLLGLPTTVDRRALVDAVAQRTGRAPDRVDALLYGAAPRDDTHLVELADELDRLDREVHGT